MLRPTPRRLLAILIALLVICSIGGTPVAAMAADEPGLTGDEVTAGFDSPDDTDRDDIDRDDIDRDGDDRDAGDDGTDDAGDADEDEEPDDTDDEDRNQEASDDTDDEKSGDDADTDRESRTRSYDRGNESRVVAGNDNLADHLKDDTEALLKANEEDEEDVFGPVDGLEGGTDEVADLSDEGLDTTEETVDVRTLKISIGVLELEILTYDDPAYGAGAAPSDGPALDTVDTPTQLRATAGTGDGAVEGERTIVLGAGGGSGEDGEPLPPTPGGGAAVALGTLAAVAAVRSSPFVATESAKAARSSGPSLLSSLLEKIRPFVLPLRYSRFDDSDPLEHESREQVYAIVNEEPGSYLSQVSEEADLPLSTTRHHIKILEREELVSGAKLRGKRRFYPAYAEGIELAAALNDDSTATIIDAISRFGAASVSDLAEELERDPSTISHHLQRLEEDDIVTRERDGRAVVTRLSSEARTALEPGSTPRPGETGEALAGGAD